LSVRLIDPEMKALRAFKTSVTTFQKTLRHITENLIFKNNYVRTQNFGSYVQGGSNMTGTDMCVNKPHCAAAVRP